ncbi:hypothetical protein ACWD6P_13995 [Streptomyces sp. NPDC002446]
MTQPLLSTTPREQAPAATAFDDLYVRHAAALGRQAYLLTGRTGLARRAVRRGFRLAWQQWPAVAVDPDPAGWVRAAVYEYALTPWHRLVPWLRTDRKPPRLRRAVAAADRELAEAVLGLPARYRRTLLLHDGVGLGLQRTAAETEASVPATAARLAQARGRVAARLPARPGQLPAGQGGSLRHRLAGLLDELAQLVDEREAAPSAARRVRAGGERSARRTTRGALAATGLFALVTLFVGVTAADRHAPPHRPPSSVAPPAPVTADEARLVPESR